MKRVALLMIRGYKTTISPYVGGRCRYWPSCSEYSYEAINKFGVVKGVWLTTKRLARCRPFGGSGVDPVP